MSQEEFTFQCLDDVFQASLLGEHEYARRGLSYRDASLIGPLTEFAFHENRDGLPRIKDLRPTLSVQALHTAQGALAWRETSLEPKSVEFLPVARNGALYGTPYWIAYQKRFERACQCAGFSTPLSRAMTCAFGEMSDNVMKHSENASSGLTGYRWTPGQIEYVVSDKGIGILRSLRTCPEYADIEDHAQALVTALRPNESRFGRASGHGTGFSSVFTSLLNLHGSLRFRSGDQALALEGNDPDLASAQVQQCPPFFDGFLVSVLCRHKNS